MYIETTANIDDGTYQLIKSTAKMPGVSGRRPVEDRVCFHLRLIGAVYESGHDIPPPKKYLLDYPGINFRLVPILQSENTA
jgi:hypothetical protein